MESFQHAVSDRQLTIKRWTKLQVLELNYREDMHELMAWQRTWEKGSELLSVAVSALTRYSTAVMLILLFASLQRTVVCISWWTIARVVTCLRRSITRKDCFSLKNRLIVCTLLLPSTQHVLFYCSESKSHIFSECYKVENANLWKVLQGVICI